MPFSSMARMRVASVYRAGGWVKCWAGSKPVSVTTSPCCQRRAGRGSFSSFVVVPALLVHGGIAGELQAAGAGPEAVGSGAHAPR